MNSVQSEWDSFVSCVLPKDAPAIQKSEMEKAFYAGAHAAFNLFIQVANDDSTSEEAKEAIMNGLLHETAQYGRDVGAGRL